MYFFFFSPPEYFESFKLVFSSTRIDAIDAALELVQKMVECGFLCGESSVPVIKTESTPLIEKIVELIIECKSLTKPNTQSLAIKVNLLYFLLLLHFSYIFRH
jgi:hypothetical protein